MWLPILFLNMLGCSRPYAAESLEIMENEPVLKGRLTPQEQHDIQDHLHEVAIEVGTTEGVSSVGVAGPRGRWSDVPAAAHDAVMELEMGIYHTLESEDHFEFQLRTLDGQPGSMMVWRTDDDSVFRVEATVGRFGDAEKARRLEDTFGSMMKKYGRKRGFEDQPLTEQ